MFTYLDHFKEKCLMLVGNSERRPNYKAVFSEELSTFYMFQTQPEEVFCKKVFLKISQNS